MAGGPNALRECTLAFVHLCVSQPPVLCIKLPPCTRLPPCLAQNVARRGPCVAKSRLSASDNCAVTSVTLAPGLPGLSWVLEPTSSGTYKIRTAVRDNELTVPASGRAMPCHAMPHCAVPRCTVLCAGTCCGVLWPAAARPASPDPAVHAPMPSPPRPSVQLRTECPARYLGARAACAQTPRLGLYAASDANAAVEWRLVAAPSPSPPPPGPPGLGPEFTIFKSQLQLKALLLTKDAVATGRAVGQPRGLPNDPTSPSLQQYEKGSIAYWPTTGAFWICETSAPPTFFFSCHHSAACCGERLLQRYWKGCWEDLGR